MDFNIFLKGHKNTVSVEHNMRSGMVTLDFAGKPMKSWQVNSPSEALLVPYNFIALGYKFTVRRGVDSEGNQINTLELDIDG